MIDFDILKECGTTNERLRQLFTAALPEKRKLDKLEPAERKQIKKDVAKRKEFEERITDWLSEQIVFSLSNASLYAAVDMAWDSTPINKQHIPLMLYAQGRIKLEACAKELSALPGSDKFVRRNDAGTVTSIDLPKFTDMNVNLLRSVITRRVAAQANKYNKLWPYYKYESRSTTAAGKLKADAVSQRMDIMADQYDYRHGCTQVTRDMMLYTRSVEFPRCAWERDVQWRRKNLAEEFSTDGKIQKEAVIVKEGVAWVNPHPGRVIYDNNYPLASLNTDNGCEWVGYWDVARYKDLRCNPDFFNREVIGFSADTAAWFTTYNSYFNQYYDRIVPPSLPQNPEASNDRKNNVGVYTGTMDDSSVFFTELFVKVKPQEWGIGSYPFPIWLHLKVAGDCTVVFAEIMPSSPAAVTEYNAHDGRLMSISMAHELMGFQDQLTNLYSALLDTIKADFFQVAVLNEDIFPDTDEGKRVMQDFKALMRGDKYTHSTNILSTSFAALRQLLGTDVTPDMVFKTIRPGANEKISDILRAIADVIAMAERLMTLSAHEQGQAVSHEISATESAALSQATDNVYDFIGAAIDEGRAAKKRIIYESTIAMGSKSIALPVVNRYPMSVIEKAGFKVLDPEDDGSGIIYATLTGGSHLLVHDYIFTSRDGGDRASNIAGAQALAQWLTAVGQLPPEIAGSLFSAMGKEKIFEIFNQIFQLAGAGVDLKLEAKPGDSDELLPEQEQQVMEAINLMGEALAVNVDEIAKVKEILARLTGGAPPPAAAA